MVPKFRAWDNECKVIRQYDELKGLTLDALDASDFKLEQYTGMKDKSGKEICEGDIVHSKVPGLSGLGIVQWNSESACFELNDIRRHTSKRGYRKYPFYRDGVYRIDGNVHENPELLEAQHDTRTD